MKLSTVVAKLTQGKAKAFSIAGGLAVAAAALTMGTPAAQAQVAFGVQFGGPRYVEPAPVVVRPYPAYGYGSYGYAAPAYGYGYSDRGYWERRRAEDWRAHEAWERHEDHEFRERQEHRFDGRRGW